LGSWQPAQTELPGPGNASENTRERDRYSILRAPFNKFVMAFFAVGRNMPIFNSQTSGHQAMAKVTLAAIRDFIGQDLGRSHWVTVDQSMIDQFAACTGDRQWIHVDADRASKESAAGGTIAHGFLSLSLIAPLGMDLGLAPVGRH
jgi:hypothetical protein